MKYLVVDSQEWEKWKTENDPNGIFCEAVESNEKAIVPFNERNKDHENTLKTVKDGLFTDNLTEWL